MDGELVDVIGNFSVVRAFGAVLREQRRIGATVAGEMAARRRSLIYLENLRLIHAVLTVFASAGVIAWGVLLWQTGRASVGDIVLVTSLAFTILHSTRDLAVALVDLTQHVARLEEAIGALLMPHELPDHADAMPLVPGPGQVTFEHVRFAYPSRAPVLREFDLTIEPGQRVGLVGFSGAGKSTVLSLLQRFYDVESGRITIDGQDIRDVTQESLRQTMAIVPQDISLFHRSVLENIRYARPDATEAQVLAAAEMAHCREFIEALPDGFATMVGDRGTKLSGGQRQRLAIARALLKDAPILLLDEATSALDSEFRARDPGGAGPADARPHGDRHRAPAVHVAALRPDHRDGSGPHHRRRFAGGVGGASRAVSRAAAQADDAAVAGSRIGRRRVTHRMDRATARDRRRLFAHRSFHALPKTIRRRDGRGGGAIVGFANLLLRLFDSEQPRARSWSDGTRWMRRTFGRSCFRPIRAAGSSIRS